MNPIDTLKPKYANDPRVLDYDAEGLDEGRYYAVLRPGLVLRGYGTHGFTFGTRTEYLTKCDLIVSEK